jgi:hypothetical protein
MILDEDSIAPNSYFPPYQVLNNSYFFNESEIGDSKTQPLASRLYCSCAEKLWLAGLLLCAFSAGAQI